MCIPFFKALSFTVISISSFDKKRQWSKKRLRRWCKRVESFISLGISFYIDARESFIA